MRGHHKTAADYAVIAVCPALIILMITALVHFLVLCLYRGQYPGRLMYILFLFILATTLIARIAIEQGRAYAFGYAAVLGLATYAVINQFVVLSGSLAALSWLFNLLLMALIWWLADRVTFDCTVIDDADRASGEGLMPASGLFGGVGSWGAQRTPAARVPLALDGTTDGPTRSNAPEGQPSEDSRALPRKKRGHQPGRWVLYLALAALPMFGLGQLLLPNFEAVRGSALRSLGLYLFATLMLLVTTSFLGLRRYLRQRGTEMPSEVSVAWLGGGALLVAAMLLVCFALPLPGRLLASVNVPNWIGSPEWLQPSRFGWGDEGAGPPQQGEPTTTAQGDAASQAESSKQSGGEQSGGEQSGGEQSGGEQSGGEQSGGEQSGGEQSGDEQSGDEQSGGEQSGGEQSGDEQSGGEQSGGEQSGGEQSGGEQSGGEQSGGEQSGGEQSGGEQSGGEQSGGEQSGGEQSGGEQSGGEQSGGEQSGGEQSGGEQSGGESRDDQPSTDGGQQDAGSQSPPSSQNSPPQLPSFPQIGTVLTTILKVVIVAVLLTVILLFALQHREMIRQWWENLLRLLRGDRPGEEPMAAATALAELKRARPFSSFRNPLSDGGDPSAAIIVSFQALEAWGRERGQPRAEGETPTEYVRRARRLFGDAAPAGERLVDAYNRVVYGQGKPTRRDLAAAEKTWQLMNAAPARAPSVGL